MPRKFREVRAEAALFFGGLGLFAKNGIPKASYYALWLLSQLGGAFLGKGDGWFAAKQGSRYILLLYNYRSNTADSLLTDWVPKNILKVNPASVLRLSAPMQINPEDPP